MYVHKHVLTVFIPATTNINPIVLASVFKFGILLQAAYWPLRYCFTSHFYFYLCSFAWTSLSFWFLFSIGFILGYKWEAGSKVLRAVDFAPAQTLSLFPFL